MENSLATTVATPSKWPGRAAPSQASLTPSTDTVVAGAAGQLGYISHTGGTKTTSAPASATDGEVALERAGVPLHVLGVTELQRVDEDADGDDVALGAGPLEERPVPGVERAHGGYEPDGRAAGAGRIEQRAARGCGLHDVHGGAPLPSSPS